MAAAQKISDEAILDVIAELRLRRALTGVALRRELHTRFGFRAGTQRVYRLLKSPPRPPAPPLPLDPSDAAQRIAELTAALQAAEKRAALAEYRETAIQDRTANEIYDLREKLRRRGIDPFA